MGLEAVVMVSGGSCLWFLVCTCVYVCLIWGFYVIFWAWVGFLLDLFFCSFPGCGLTMSGWFFGFRY